MGRTAFITGASRGIGRAIARRLAAEGWSVGIDYLQARDQALALEEELRGQGYQALAVRADVADREAITAAVTRVEMAFGPVSLLVNNAGTASQRQFQDIEEDFWRRIFAVNVDGAFHTIQAVLPHMLHEKAGSIVNISSIWGQRGASCESAYSATKAALIGLTRSLAMELAPSGIRVNCVAPGVIRTDMVEVLGRETLAALAEETPMGRLGTPEEVAEAVAFLGGVHHRPGPHGGRRLYSVRGRAGIAKRDRTAGPVSLNIPFDPFPDAADGMGKEITSAWWCGTPARQTAGCPAPTADSRPQGPPRPPEPRTPAPQPARRRPPDSRTPG